MSEEVKEETKSIPVDFSNPEFVKFFMIMFNRLDARLGAVESLIQPLAKQARIEQLEKELAELKK